MSKITNWVIASMVIGLGVSVFVGWPFGHLRPPDIADGVLTDRDWSDFENGSRKINAAVERFFPVGTPANVLIATLTDQGFAIRSTQQCATMMPEGRWPKPWRETTKCWYPPGSHQMLEYEWGGMPCSQLIIVTWAVDARNRITMTKSHYGGACI